jgi:hypothetical protein
MLRKRFPAVTAAALLQADALRAVQLAVPRRRRLDRDPRTARIARAKAKLGFNPRPLLWKDSRTSTAAGS